MVYQHRIVVFGLLPSYGSLDATYLNCNQGLPPIYIWGRRWCNLKACKTLVDAFKKPLAGPCKERYRRGQILSELMVRSLSGPERHSRAL